MARKTKLSFDTIRSRIEATPEVVVRSPEPVFDRVLDLTSDDAQLACSIELRYAQVSAWLLKSSKWFKPNDLEESILAEDQDGELTQSVESLQQGKDLSVALVHGWGPMVGKLCVRCAEGTALIAFSSADVDGALSRKELLELVFRVIDVALREQDFERRQLGGDAPDDD
jgi:hypothetical protein